MDAAERGSFDDFFADMLGAPRDDMPERVLHARVAGGPCPLCARFGVHATHDEATWNAIDDAHNAA